MSTSRRAKLLLLAAVATATLALSSAPVVALDLSVPSKTPPGTPAGDGVHLNVPGAEVSAGNRGLNVTLVPAAQPPPPQGGQSQAPASSPAPAETTARSPGAGGTERSTNRSSPSSGGATPRHKAAAKTVAHTQAVTAASPSTTNSSAGSPAPAAGARAAPAATAGATPRARSRPARSVVERIVLRIPREFLAALCAALLAAIAFAAVWMRERRRTREARREALVDPLTGIPNRLAFYERLSHEWRRSRRYDRPLGLLMLDMDGLKQINDGAGHAAGDRALRTVADSIAADIRHSDLAARLAGDEFVVLSPETHGDGLNQLAEKLRGRLDESGAGMSIGVAQYDPADESPEDMLARADEAMYRDKERRSPPGGPRRTGSYVPRRPRARPGFAISGLPARRAS